MKNPGRIFLFSAILLAVIFTVNAFADGIQMQAKQDLPYGKIWYFRGAAVNQQEFVTYGIYLKKDRCHFWSKADGVIRKGETVTLTFDDKSLNTPDKLVFKVSRTGTDAQIAGMTCSVVNNPEPETLDDVKAFLQIQFGASADIQ